MSLRYEIFSSAEQIETEDHGLQDASCCWVDDLDSLLALLVSDPSLYGYDHVLDKKIVLHHLEKAKLIKAGEFEVLEVSAEHCFVWGGMALCDSCNSFSKRGYLPLALNWYLCPACYVNWFSHAKWYEGDRWFQDHMREHYSSVIGVYDETKK